MLLKAKGCIINGMVDINMSDIYSFLINKVGKLTTAYASDLFYDLKGIEKTVMEARTEIFIIGIRETGVDGKEFVRIKLENPVVYGQPYLAIYSVLIEADNAEITATLSTVFEKEEEESNSER